MKTSTNPLKFFLLAILVVFGAQMVQAADEPLQVVRNIVMQNGTNIFRETMFTVPKNKQLVIEFFSCNYDVPSGQSLFVVLETDGGGHGLHSFLAAKQGSPPGQDSFIISQLVRIFADPGTDVVLTAQRITTAGSVVGTCGFTGQLIDIKNSK